MAKGKLHTYKVWYSGRSAATVRAYTASGAKRQAWELLGGFKYGWSKKDFLRKATVERLD